MPEDSGLMPRYILFGRAHLFDVVYTERCDNATKRRSWRYRSNASVFPAFFSMRWSQTSKKYSVKFSLDNGSKLMRILSSG